MLATTWRLSPAGHNARLNLTQIEYTKLNTLQITQHHKLADSTYTNSYDELIMLNYEARTIEAGSWKSQKPEKNDASVSSLML